MQRIAALYATSVTTHILTASGEVLSLPISQAYRKVGHQPLVICHAASTLQRLGNQPFKVFDVLELYAFVRPGVFCVPSPLGLAQALDLDEPQTVADYPVTIAQAAASLLSELKHFPEPEKQDLADLANLMALGGKGWAWAPEVLQALGIDPEEGPRSSRELFARFLKRLPETMNTPSEAPKSFFQPSADDVEGRLNLMVHQGVTRENRPDQSRYAALAAQAFAPMDDLDQPSVVLAEAGTGTGKTLGYLAPASLWAEKNDGTVWISTYTKNLQKQLDQELKRLPMADEDRDRYAVTRKGRENYLCLLNFAEFAAGAPYRPNPQGIVAAGLLLRWIMATRDGDFTGVDYPGWLTTLMGGGQTVALADRRGECIHGACEFYDRCFIERSVRKARRARVVIANHALVMSPGGLDDDNPPGYYVFDEGHHLMDAADSAFDINFSLREGYDLRRWVLGAEGGRKSRLRGLKKRIEDLAADDEGRKILDEVGQVARCLPGEGALDRLRDGQPVGLFEQALGHFMQQVRARAQETPGGYSLETAFRPPVEGIEEVLGKLRIDLIKLQAALQKLVAYLGWQLQAQAEDMASEQRARLQIVIRGIERRSQGTLESWVQLLGDSVQEQDHPDFVEWLEVSRQDGVVGDVGLFRRWRNPLKPFAAAIRGVLKGALITSATLRDRATEEGWGYARAATGLDLLSSRTTRDTFPSPFNHAAQTRILVVGDVAKDNLQAVAGAYQSLFAAAEGGALGLFTAINRLRAVQAKIVEPLESMGLTLYAQHVDKMDNGTLVDLFRADRHACLLGTDAMRDGVDVPGDSLRLLVYDRMPWPLTRILHKARREEFGGRTYDEQLTRLRLKQAYGRLIRRQGDRGVFVLLDPSLPTRLCDAFPDGVSIERVGLKQAVEIVQKFFQTEPQTQINPAAAA